MQTRVDLVNYVLYQAGWLALVLLAAAHRPLMATVVGLGLVAVHLALVVDRRVELRLLVIAAVSGFVVESLQVTLGGLRFQSGTLVDGVAPPWIVVLWVQFAATLRFCLRWLGRDWRAAAGFGALGGPFAYWLGERLGAVRVDGGAAWALLALLWALAIPTLARLASGSGSIPGRYRGTE